MKARRGREEVMVGGHRQEVASMMRGEASQWPGVTSMALQYLQRQCLISQASGKHGSKGGGAPKISEGESCPCNCEQW